MLWGGFKESVWGVIRAYDGSLLLTLGNFVVLVCVG